jgi:hypothetical protein
MKKIRWIALAMLLLMMIPMSAHAQNASGNIRGVTFFYLDGERQGFPWVLENQYDPVVRAKIDNLLAEYRSAGVNWIRLLVATDHFPVQSDIHPVPSAALIKKVNDFMAITRSGPNAGRFTIELMLIPQQKNALFTDVAPYTRDKLWYKTWIDQLNYTNLGLIMFGGDLSPCYLSGCEGEASADPLPNNHGKWIKSIWAWRDQNYSFLSTSYEVIGVQSLSNNDPALIKKLARWMNINTPTNPIVAASVYVELPSGSSWQQYAEATVKILDAYHSVSDKTLWIDEFGKSFGTNWNLQDQRNAYQGFLGASVCWRQRSYPKFAWVAGNDYPYDGKNWSGLVSQYFGTYPIMRDTWRDLSLYYNLKVCP